MLIIYFNETGPEIQAVGWQWRAKGKSSILILAIPTHVLTLPLIPCHYTCTKDFTPRKCTYLLITCYDMLKIKLPLLT